MSMVLNEEQRMLQESAAEFFKVKLNVDQFRASRDKNQVVRVDDTHWQAMVALGWSSILVPEEFGGIDFGIKGLGVVCIEAGKYLATSHLVNASGQGVALLLACDRSERRDDLLSGIADGTIITACAQDGATEFVAEASTATHLLIPKNDVVQIYELEKASLATSRGCLDSRDYVSIKLGSLDDPYALNASVELNVANEIVAVLTAAEMFGISEEVFDRTLQYLKEREQFGQKIGSFQALQHRMAVAYTELQLFKSTLLDAFDALETNREDSLLAVSHAKLLANETSSLICTEAIQMHGGMGITDELDIGLFYKRARVLRTQYGGSAELKQRCANLLGF